MNTPPFVVVADRGNFKAFAIEPTQVHGPAPRLLESIEFTDARQDFSDRFSDQAGGFPNAGTQGKGNSHAERLSLETELDLRLFRQISEHLNKLLEDKNPKRWGFAAPAEINGALLERVDSKWKERLTANLT